MFKKLGLAICLVLGTWLLVITTGCGSSSSTEATTTTATTSTTSTTAGPTGNITISGTLNSGVLSASGLSSSSLKIQAKAFAAISDYNIIAVSKDTGQAYFAATATDASGNFSIPNLPADEKYFIEVLDSSNKLVAPIAFGSSNEGAVMAIDPKNGNVSLGAIAYDSAKGCAAPTTPPTANFDLAATVEAKNGETLVPKGAENFGKGSVTEISAGNYVSNTTDGDKDGLPNSFDADNNGDLVVDELDGLFSFEAINGANANFYLYAFTNLKVDYDQRDTFKDNFSTFSVAIGLSAGNKSGAATKSISSVRIIGGPTWMADANVVGGSKWSTSNYNVPLKMPNVYEVQLNNVRPTFEVNAGDTLKYLITYDDASTEEAIKMINFVFSDIPRVVAFKVGDDPWNANLPANGRLSIATTSEVGLRWTRPKDEAGNEIIGGRYTWEYNSNSGGAIETTVITSDANALLTSLEATLDVMTLPDFKSADAQGEFMIGVCIRSQANDNSAENCRFSKGW